MIRIILERNKKSVFQNQSGANLLNGIASSLVKETISMEKLREIMQYLKSTKTLCLNIKNCRA